MKIICCASLLACSFAIHAADYFPPPDSVGGWRTATNAPQMREVTAALAPYAGQDITALVIQQPNFFGVLEDVDALTDWAHARGMHFWLHACGNIEPFIPRLIDLGLDVLHPIQKYTMDEREIARRYGERTLDRKRFAAAAKAAARPAYEGDGKNSPLGPRKEPSV